MKKFLYIILIICIIFLTIRFIIVKNQIPEPELIKKETLTKYNSNFTYQKCENWCSEMKFRGQEYVICLTGCNMKKEK